MSEIKLIVTDMDGCLLNSDKQVPIEIFSIVDELKKKNITFCVASGRQYSNIYEKLNKRNDILFIGENGGVAMMNQELLHINSLDDNIIKEIITRVRTIDQAYPVLCAKDVAYIENTNEDFTYQVSLYYSTVIIVDNLLDVKDKFCKVAICDFKYAQENTLAHFIDMREKYQVIVSADIWLDIFCLGQSKGDTLQMLQNKFNITMDQTMAFGDYLNDYEMLQMAKYSYAMENAVDPIKEIAKYIAPSNDEKGVITIINQFLEDLE